MWRVELLNAIFYRQILTHSEAQYLYNAFIIYLLCSWNPGSLKELYVLKVLQKNTLTDTWKIQAHFCTNSPKLMHWYQPKSWAVLFIAKKRWAYQLLFAKCVSHLSSLGWCTSLLGHHFRFLSLSQASLIQTFGDYRYIFFSRNYIKPALKLLFHLQEWLSFN